MSKKYLSLEEAAQLLGLETEDLIRMRERQEIRGFADRGTWKFKIDDVENLARSRQADSNPEVPIITGNDYPGYDDSTDSHSVFGEGIEDEQPTIISRNSPLEADSSLFDDDDNFLDPLADSDSDVRLVGGPDVDLDFDSDSDVQLAGMDSNSDSNFDDPSGTIPEMKFEGLDSDSDVKLIGPDSDSDVSLEDSVADLSLGSDSDINLVGSQSIGMDSDSDVSLEDSVADMELMNSDSEIKLLRPEITAGSDSDSDVSLQDSRFELDATGSDSDVKLMGPDVDLDFEDSMSELDLLDSDSDIKMVGPGGESDIQFIDENNVSDLNYMDSGTMPEMSLASDSEVENLLAPEESGILPSESAIFGADSGSINTSDSDSDVQLLGDDEDVMLIDESEDALAIDLTSDNDLQSSVLADESGISLGGDSSLMLGGESGISLEGPSDSGIALDAGSDEGITLALDDDSGISLDAGDSGISLENIGDSGISLESIGDSGISLEGDSFSGTIPMMDVMEEDDVAETAFEIPSLSSDEDSAYDLNLDDDGSEDDTGVVELIASGEQNTLDDAVFDLDDDEESYESGSFANDLELEDDAFDEDEGLDVFDADDDVFDEAGEDQEFAAPLAGNRMQAVEQDWGMFTFIGLVMASLLMLLCGVVMLDLVKNTATASSPNPISGMVLDMLGGLYKS